MARRPENRSCLYFRYKVMEKNEIIDVVGREEDCSGCHACFNACPVQAIEMRPDENGFLYPVILHDKCIQCNKCKKVCPTLHKPTDFTLQMAYGCYANKKEEHASSSSGGVFSVLARMVLSMNGIVCGAVYDEKLAVCHHIIDSEDELYRLKETKYVQSRIGDVYKSIENALVQQRVVLFSGTPCQVSGLKGYLGKEFEKLICVDLICHGVPSPEVWQRYLKEIAGEKQIVRVTFRNKTQGISKITLDYHLDDGSVVKENYSDSLYMKGFIQNLFVRPSCFNCKYKGIKRCSDMTIGDFWSIKEYHPEFFHESGVSAVIVHSEKGKLWFDRAKVGLCVVQATSKEIACWNESLLTPAIKNPRSNTFFECWNEQELLGLIKQLTENSKKEEQRTILSRLKNGIREWTVRGRGIRA